MSLIVEQRLSDSPFVEAVMHGWTVSEGTSLRPAEVQWHMVFTRVQGSLYPLIVGPWISAGSAAWGEGAEILWVRFKLGVFMPHLPARNILNTETRLPEAASDSAFWLRSSAWQFPDYENVDTFIDRLARDEVLMWDPVVSAGLQDQLHPQAMSPRTLRHRFLRATGMTQSHIRQFRRAQQAEALLRRGATILDTVDEAGYFDQPHLTRALKQFIGYTPAQIVRMSTPDCHSVQDTDPVLEYDTNVLTNTY